MRFSHFSPWIDGLGFGYSIFDQSQFSPSCAGAPTFCGFEWHAQECLRAGRRVPDAGAVLSAANRALPMMSRLRQNGSARRMGTFLLSLRAVHERPGCFSRRCDGRSVSHQLGRRSGCPTNPPEVLGLPLFAVISILPEPVRDACFARGGGSAKTTNSRTRTAGASRSTSRHRGRACWRGLRRQSQQRPAKHARRRGQQHQPGTSRVRCSPPAIREAPSQDYIGPSQGYGDLNLATNNLYSNYNALQVSWARHAGLYTMQSNYTWQKALGIVQPRSIRSISQPTTAILPSDRRHLFNAAYSIDLGDRVHVNPACQWRLERMAVLRHHPDAERREYHLRRQYANNVNTNYNMALSCVPTAAETAAGITCPQSAAIIPGSVSASKPKGIPINNQSILGTNAAATESAGDVQSERDDADLTNT